MLHNPYQYRSPITNKRLFFGHHQLLDHVVHTLENEQGRVLCVIGSSLMGKTTFLYQLEQSLTHCLAIFIDFNQVKFTSAEDMYYAIMEAMFGCVKDCGCFSAEEGKCFLSGGKPQDTGIEGIKNRLVNLMESFEKKGEPLHFALLIDNADTVIKAPWCESFFSYFHSLITDRFLKHHISAVITTTPEFYHEISLCYSMFTLMPFNKATVRELVQCVFSRNSEEFTTEVFEKTGGHPFLVQYVLSQLYEEKDSMKHDIGDIVRNCPVIVNSRT